MKSRYFPLRIGIMLFITAILFSRCNRETFYRTDTGLIYRIVSTSGTDSVARIGTVVKLHFIQKAGDSIVDNNYEKMPFYWNVMPGGLTNRYNPLEVFDYTIREGDSLVIIQRLDSMVKKRSLDSLPSYLKGDDEWTTYMKVERVFRGDSAVQMDKLREQKRVDTLQRMLGDARIEKYLKQYAISAPKQSNGVYLQTIAAGQGAQADSGMRVGIKYSFFNQTTGKLFDSNTDPSFHHKDTMFFKVGGPFMVRSVDQTIRQLKVGAHAKMFIPTMEAFGGRPPHGNLRPYDDLSFEVWVLSVDSSESLTQPIKAPEAPRVHKTGPSGR